MSRWAGPAWVGENGEDRAISANRQGGAGLIAHFFASSVSKSDRYLFLRSSYAA